MTEGIEREARERLAENLHIWYLEATRELKPESFNPNAQKSYADLTEEQKFLDRYIAGKMLAAFAQSCELAIVKSIHERYCAKDVHDSMCDLQMSGDLTALRMAKENL